MSSNKLFVADKQQQKAAARRVLHSVQRRRQTNFTLHPRSSLLHHQLNKNKTERGDWAV